MANPSTQDSRRVALKNDSFQRQSWYLNLANRFANSWQMRLKERDIMGKLAQLNRLIGLGVGNHVTHITDCE
jgi:hypothetical protein